MKIELKKEAKKSAIVSYGTRVSIDSKNVRSVDLFYLREYLINELGRSQVDFVTLKSKKDISEDREYFKNISETDLNDYDEVWCYNCTMNAFGGLIKLEAIQTFKQLVDFNGTIYYMLIDPKMPCMNFAGYVKGKMESHDGKVPTPDKDIPLYDELSYDDIKKYTDEVWPNIVIAFDGDDYEKYYKLWNKQNARSLNKNPNGPNKIIYNKWCKLPLAEYYSVNERSDLKLKNYDNFDSKEYDLIYFGNNRNTNRNTIVKNLYDKKGNKIFISGYDPEFKNAEYTSCSYVDHDDLFPLICKCFATVVVGDELHNNNIMTARFFESMQLDVVAFIYNKYDEEKKYIKNKELADFIYINDATDLQEKLQKIKSDKNLYNRIVELERSEIQNQFGHFKKS